MKIKLTSTLPFTPVQLDAKHASPQRVVGQLHGMSGDREYRTAVYKFRHGDNDQIHYQIDAANGRVYLDQMSEPSTPDPSHIKSPVVDNLQWIEHDDSLSYKPYSFLVMNAITKLVGNWDGVVYSAPSGERLRDSAWHATIQVVDACVCHKFGLWVRVALSGDKVAPMASGAIPARQMGWVPV